MWFYNISLTSEHAVNILKSCSAQEYHVILIFQILLIMLQRMELLLKLTPAEDIQQHVLPMLYRGLDCESPQVHELCLGVLPTFAGLLDHANVKNSVLPRIKKLCLNTSTLSVRVNCLLCVGKLLEHLDKWLVLDEILPFLPQIPSREPAVLMGILGIYKIAMTHKKLGITKEIVASRVLPFLIPLCIENGLTIPQFNALTTLVKEMFQLVESEHRTKLEQLNSVKNEQKALASSVPVITPSSKPVELDSAFAGLGLDNYVPGGISLQQKQNIVKQQDSIAAFSSQPTITPVKAERDNGTLSAPPSSSLIDDWVFSPTSDATVNHNNMWTNNSFDLNVTQNNNMIMKNQVSYPNMINQNSYPDRNSNRNTAFQPQIQNISSVNTSFQFPIQSTSKTNTSFHSPVQNVNNVNLSSNYSSMQSYNNSFTSPNPWSSNQVMNTITKTESSHNWSALDNLISVNSHQNSKISMNMMTAQKTPLMSSNSNIQSTNSGNKYGLSNKDIADLLE